MKFISKILIFASCCMLILSGCGTVSQPGDMMKYCSYPGEALLTGKVGETEFQLKVYFPGKNQGESTGDFRMIVMAPEDLKGTELLLTNSESYLISEDVKIPVSRDAVSGIAALPGAFLLDSGSISSIEAPQTGTGESGTSVVCTKDGIQYTIYMDQNDVPVRMKWNDGYDADFTVTEFISHGIEKNGQS